MKSAILTNCKLTFIEVMHRTNGYSYIKRKLSILASNIQPLSSS